MPTTDLNAVLPEGTPPELIQAIKNAVANTLHQHGLAAFTMPREAALTHEAGHAIVAAHEGIVVRRVSVFSNGADQGGGCCTEAGTWTTGPNTTADDDLRRARVIIAGLAAEALTGTDKLGSSLDELALSQFIGLNAAAKLDPHRSDDEYAAYAEQLWHSQVWDVALAIIRANPEPFLQIVQHLHRDESLQGAMLRRTLAQVQRITR